MSLLVVEFISTLTNTEHWQYSWFHRQVLNCRNTPTNRTESLDSVGYSPTVDAYLSAIHIDFNVGNAVTLTYCIDSKHMACQRPRPAPTRRRSCRERGWLAAWCVLFGFWYDDTTKFIPTLKSLHRAYRQIEWNQYKSSRDTTWMILLAGLQDIHHIAYLPKPNHYMRYALSSCIKLQVVLWKNSKCALYHIWYDVGIENTMYSIYI